MTEPTPKDPPAVTNPANRALTTRRDTLLASLGRAEAFLVDYDADRDERQVAIRLEHLENVWASLEEVQMQLECAEESEEGRALHAEVRADFEERFLIIKSDLTSKLPVITNETEVPQTVHPTSALSGLKLPTISLPEFDGDYMQWLGFHDTFLALIHSNAEVPAIQKFHYLKAALKGEAAQLIESIAISAANYNLAWTTLVGRYANEYLLKKRHLQAIFDIQRMKRETAATLHGLVDEFERHVKTLKQMGEPTDQWSSILEHLLCTRLHDDTLKAWEDHASTLQTPSYSCLVEFLQRRMRVLESISVNHHASPSSANHSHQNARRPQQFRLSSNASTTKAGKRCPVCDKDHFIAKCQKFLELPVAKRQQVVYRKRLCLKCLRGDHVVKNCDSDGSCRTCDRQHHTLLHAEARENSQRTNSETHFSSTPAVVQIPTSVQPKEGEPGEQSAIAATEDCAVSVPVQLPRENVFLQTVLVKVVDAFGQEHLARALLDSGSQPNLITERLARLLRLKKSSVNVTIQGAGQLEKPVRESIVAQVKSRVGGFELGVSFLVMDKVTAKLPACDIPVEEWEIPKELPLADPTFNVSQRIDMILGAKHFHSFFPSTTRVQLG